MVHINNYENSYMSRTTRLSSTALTAALMSKPMQFYKFGLISNLLCTFDGGGRALSSLGD